MSGMFRFLSEEQYCSIAKKIIELKPVSVTITGGEPFLVFHKIKKAVEDLIEAEIHVSFNTNAGVLDNAIIDFLLQHNISLFVSFPCSDEVICNNIIGKENGYNNVLRKLDLAYERGVKFNFNIVVSKMNINTVQQSVCFLKQRYNISGINITRVGKPINSDASFDKYLLNKDDLKQLQDICVFLHKKLNITVGTSCPFTPCSLYSQEAFDLFGLVNICTAGKTSYAIDTSGNIKACPRDSTLYGNILNEQFSEIWKRVGEWRNMSLIPYECRECEYVQQCLGGCRVDSYPLTGKKNQLDTVSDISNLPIRYKKSTPRNNILNETSEFIVSEKIVYVEDNDCVRASVGKLYIYLTYPMYKFLSGRNAFTFYDFQSHFCVDANLTKNALLSLITKKIIRQV